MESINLPSRPVHTVFLHCSASDNPAHDNVAVMRDWHRARGWNDVGYHIFIRKSGELQAGRPLDREPAAQSGHNAGTIAVCLHGLARERFTPAQFRTLIGLARALRDRYAGRGVALRFRGHGEVSEKACPVFDYRRVLGLDGSGRLTGRTCTDAQPPLGMDMPAPAGPGRDLDLFDRGEDVRALQRALADRGFDAGPADGVFGQRTRAAVAAFQRSIGWSPNGVADAETRRLLTIG